MLYEINEKALKLESQGKKIIKLNLGDPDLATPNEIIEAAYESMKRGKKRSTPPHMVNCPSAKNSPASTASQPITS
jgi:aspartate/methionine/tyrosine aminotransferase